MDDSFIDIDENEDKELEKGYSYGPFNKGFLIKE
jgi:hypothetical protein